MSYSIYIYIYVRVCVRHTPSQGVLILPQRSYIVPSKGLVRSLGVTCGDIRKGCFPDVPADDNTPIFLAFVWFHGPCVINTKTLPAEVSLCLRSLPRVC